MIELRPYQRDAVQALREALRDHHSSLLVQPTGTGKTIVMAELVRHEVQRGRRVLLLAHREELLTQAAEKFERATPGLRMGIERAERQVCDLEEVDVVIASIQTLSRARRLARFASDAFALILIDEAHHAPAPSYRRVLEHFATSKIVGVTATPDRLDGAALGDVFGVCAYRYEIRQAIADGWLAPIVQRLVRVDALDLSRVRTMAGDLSAGDLERELTRDRVLHEVAAPLVTLAGTRQTIVFTAGVAQAHALAEVIALYGGRAVALDATADRASRGSALQDFATGATQFLVNCGLFTEGFDAPATSCIAIARPTKSRALYAQMAGRGMRLSPDTGKSDCLILDFVGNAGRHRLVSTLDVLAGKAIDDATQAQAERIAAEQPQLSAHELLDAAQDAAEQAQRHAVAKARFEAIAIDPFATTLLELDVADMPEGGESATPRQISALQASGVRAQWAQLTKRQASALLDRVAHRRARGLSTIKQAAQLARRGLNPDVDFELARFALDVIAANQWRTPDSLRCDPRFQHQSAGAAA